MTKQEDFINEIYAIFDIGAGTEKALKAIALSKLDELIQSVIAEHKQAIPAAGKSKEVIYDDPHYPNMGVIHQPTDAGVSEIIKFGVWYSGMKEIQVRAAYERYLRETNLTKG